MDGGAGVGGMGATGGGGTERGRTGGGGAEPRVGGAGARVGGAGARLATDARVGGAGGGRLGALLAGGRGGAGGGFEVMTGGGRPVVLAGAAGALERFGGGGREPGARETGPEAAGATGSGMISGAVASRSTSVAFPLRTLDAAAPSARSSGMREARLSGGAASAEGPAPASPPWETAAACAPEPLPPFCERDEVFDGVAE